MSNLNFKQTYMTLPKELYKELKPYNNNKSTISLLNTDLIKELGLDSSFFQSEKGILLLSGSTDEFGPLFSQAYAGHQYGYFTNLGDGRAVILGEIESNNQRFDLQLKGSGPTPYSRRGDGLATLYSMLREYIISEAMHHLNIPTTRSLAVLDTSKKIRRKTLEQGGILCRVAKSHIRVGTFEYTARNTTIGTIQSLADYSIKRHYNHLSNKDDKYQLFLREVIKNQASLIAKWQSVGFVHGVMNTDNMTISGETIDYGPCAFLDTFHPKTSFSSIDEHGRYAYQNQPYIGSWNLMKFAESILPLLAKTPEEAIHIANKELQSYETYFKQAYYDLFGKKLGILDPTDEEKILIDELLLIMEKYKADFTNTFRLLTLSEYKELPFYDTNDFTLWFQKWTRKLGYRKSNPKNRFQLMKSHNPVIIPRNQLLEQALINASTKNDFTLFNQLLEKIKDPYNYSIPHNEQFLNPYDKDAVFTTYCGT